MLDATREIHCLRDATRGGVASVLNELAGQSRVGIDLDESAIPVRPAVQAACEMLGMDPLYVANEGKLVAVVPAPHADVVLDAMRRHPYGRDAVIIGQVVGEHPGLVVARTATRPTSTPIAPASRDRISSRAGAMRGRSPTRTQSALTSS